MTQVVEIQEDRTYLFYIVNVMGADVLGTQGVRASATALFTMLNQINSVPARWRLIFQAPTVLSKFRLTLQFVIAGQQNVNQNLKKHT